MRGRLLIAMLALAFFCKIASGQQDLALPDQVEPQARSYYFSSDPGLELLKVRYVGGSTGGVVSFSVFADGRFVYKLTATTNEETIYMVEGSLAHEEVLALLDTAVDGGLVDFDEERTMQKMKSARPIGYAPDSTTMILDLFLPSYKKSAESEVTAISKTIHAQAPIWRAQRYPEVKELQALAAIARGLNRYKGRAEAK